MHCVRDAGTGIKQRASESPAQLIDGCGPRCGNRQGRVDGGLAAQLRDRLIRKAAEPKHLPPFRNHDACLPGFGLAGLKNSLRHSVCLEELGVPVELLGSKNVLRDGL